jgi:hypothetical protein
MTFKQISDLLDVPVAQLQVLNPSYKLNVIPFYQNENHYFYLKKIAVLYLMKLKYMPTFNMNWINAETF